MNDKNSLMMFYIISAILVSVNMEKSLLFLYMTVLYIGIHFGSAFAEKDFYDGRIN